MDRIAPSDWLHEHQPVGDFGALDAGCVVLASHSSNVWVVMHSEPEPRLETALAWLSEVGEGETLRTRVRQLAEFIDAGDEARRDD